MFRLIACVCYLFVLFHASIVQCQLLGGLLGGNPRIALKVMPSKKMKMSKSDMNSLLLDLRHEIRKQVGELEEQQAEKQRIRERTSSTWASHGAPIFVPNQETPSAMHQMPPAPIPTWAFRQIEGNNGHPESSYRFFQRPISPASVLPQESQSDTDKLASDVNELMSSLNEISHITKDASLSEEKKNIKYDNTGNKNAQSNSPRKNGPISLA